MPQRLEVCGIPSDFPSSELEEACAQTRREESKSIRVRKSIVLNSRSIAGGPQIPAPTAKYARNNLGTLLLAPPGKTKDIAKSNRGEVQTRLDEVSL